MNEHAAVVIRWTPKDQRVPWRLLLPITAATVLLMLALWPIENQIVRSAGVVAVAIGHFVVVGRLGRRFRAKEPEARRPSPR